MVCCKNKGILQNDKRPDAIRAYEFFGSHVENWDGTDEELISLFENYKPDYIAHSYQVKNMMRNDKRVTDKVKELLAKKKQSKGTKK